MFLLQIINNKKLNKKNFIFYLIKHINLIKKLNNKLLFIKKIKKLKNFSTLNNICYIINIILTKKYSTIYLTDIKGKLIVIKSIKISSSKKKQKIKQSKALLKLLKFFISNTFFLKKKPLALHIKNIEKYYINIILDLLENLFFIKVIKIFDFLIPHNGCRPKKLKRKKNFKIKFN